MGSSTRHHPRITAALFVWLLGLLPLWLVVAAFISRFVPGRWRAFRLTWFLVVYLAFELITLAALFVLWVASGFGATLRSEASIARHHRLLAWFLRRVMGSARFTFGLQFVDASDDGRTADPERPLLVFSRHAGAGDSFLLVDAIANGPQPRRPLIVLKDLLQLDPVIDVMLHRVGASFVTSGQRAGDAVVAEVARLAAGAGPSDALVLFPEGGNFTSERRERAIEKLDLIGRPDLAVRAEHLTHLLPPEATRACRPRSTRRPTPTWRSWVMWGSRRSRRRATSGATCPPITPSRRRCGACAPRTCRRPATSANAGCTTSGSRSISGSTPPWSPRRRAASEAAAAAAPRHAPRCANG